MEIINYFEFELLLTTKTHGHNPKLVTRSTLLFSGYRLDRSIVETRDAIIT